MDLSRSRMVSLSEQFFPFVLAALEACLIDILCVWLANLGFLGSNELLFPLWLPYLVLASACWVTHYPTRRVAQAFPALRQDAERFFAPPYIPLLILIVVLEVLFVICSNLYSSFFWNSFLQTTYMAVTALNIGRVLALLIALGLLGWRGLHLANTVIDSSQITRILRIGLAGIALFVIARAAQEFFFPTVITHTDVSFFFLAVLLGCLSVFAYSLTQRAYLFHFHATGILNSFRYQEYLYLSALASFWLFALVVLWSIIYFFNHQLAVGTITYPPDPGLYPTSWKSVESKPKQQLSSGADQAQVAIVSWFKILVLVVLVVCLIVLVVIIIRRLRTRIQDENEKHESLWSWTLFWHQLRAVVTSFFTRLSPSTRKQPTEERGEFVTRSEPGVHTIRQLYTSLLRYASRKGLARTRTETPSEFRSRLNQHLSFAEPYLGEITDAYIASRYGQYDYDEAQMAMYREAWDKLQQRWM